MQKENSKIEVENVNVPGYVHRVDRARYEAMREALMKVLPDAPPGMKVAEAQAALKQHLDQTLFPGGEKSGWWLKAVHLDLEAKGIVERAPSKPVRIFRRK